MKIIVAPDSYKGNLSAVEVANCMEAGIKKAGPQIDVVKVPVADGGEGTVEALVTATGGRIIEVENITGPLGNKINSFFGVLGDNATAVIEMAAAAGLHLVPPEKRNPLHTTTYGVGELIIEALNYGCRGIIIGLGGSATNDGGMGMARALGVKFYDKNSKPVGSAGKHLASVESADMRHLDSRIGETSFTAASDVKNLFYGRDGASRVYAPQKGADEETVNILEEGMRHFAEVIFKEPGKYIGDVPGSGAAGGLGGGLMAFTGAVLKPGIEMVMESCNLDEIMRDARLVITGEGKTDHQTAFGKVPAGIASLAEKNGVPVICLSGSLAEGFEEIYKIGIDAAFSNITGPMSLAEAMEKSAEMLTHNAYAVTRVVLAINKSKEDEI